MFKKVKKGGFLDPPLGRYTVWVTYRSPFAKQSVVALEPPTVVIAQTPASKCELAEASSNIPLVAVV